MREQKALKPLKALKEMGKTGSRYVSYDSTAIGSIAIVQTNCMHYSWNLQMMAVDGVVVVLVVDSVVRIGVRMSPVEGGDGECIPASHSRYPKYSSSLSPIPAVGDFSILSPFPTSPSILARSPNLTIFFFF